MINRREASICLCSSGFSQLALCAELMEERHQGDLMLDIETFTFDRDIVKHSVGPNKASYIPMVKNFDASIISVASEFVGKNRRDNRDVISTMLSSFDLPFEKDGKPYAFCAAGLAWVAALAYARTQAQIGTGTTVTAVIQYYGEINHYHFYPSPSVIDMVNVAKGQRRWIDKKDVKSPSEVKKGWLIVFQFSPGAYHVGLIEGISSNQFSTIEFNTSGNSGADNRDGGSIAKKKRNFDNYVHGFISTNKILRF